MVACRFLTRYLHVCSVELADIAHNFRGYLKMAACHCRFMQFWLCSGRKDLQKRFMPEVTNAGLIQSLLDNFSGIQVCSKLIYLQGFKARCWTSLPCPAFPF